MTVQELKELLANYPDEMEVVLNVEAGQVIVGISKEYSGEYNGQVQLMEV